MSVIDPGTTIYVELLWKRHRPVSAEGGIVMCRIAGGMNYD